MPDSRSREPGHESPYIIMMAPLMATRRGDGKTKPFYLAINCDLHFLNLLYLLIK